MESLSVQSKWPRTKDEHWQKSNYGLLFNPDGIARVKPENRYGDYVLRLEWKADGTAAEIGVAEEARVTTVRLNDSGGKFIEGQPPKSVDNPPGQWNFLQLTLKDGKLSVWQNGTGVVNDFDTSSGQAVDGGFLVIRATEPGMQFRNIRIKAAAQATAQ